MNYFRKTFLLAISIMSLFGCGGDNPITSSGTTPITEEEQAIISEIETSYQKTTFLLTDAPSDAFKSIVVDINSPIVLTMEGGATTTVPIPLPNNLPIRVDLLELDGLSEVLASAVVPAGTVKTIKLRLASPEITPLVGLPIGPSGIDLTPDWEITLSAPITIPEKEGATIQMDFDVINSVKIATNGRLHIKPSGLATQIKEATHSTGIALRKVRGTIVRILSDRPRHFLLKYLNRPFYLPVDASGTTTEIFTHDGKVEFSALKVGQLVEVGGTFTDKHVLKAQSVLLLPENFRRIRGMVTNLNQTTFTLSHILERDAVMASSTEIIGSSTIVHYSNALRRYAHTLDSATSTNIQIHNGQRVEVYGLVSVDGRGLDARVIIIHPEHFRGFVVENCLNNRVRVIRRYITETIFDVSTNSVVDPPCTSLKKGTRVEVVGQIVPSTDPLNVVKVDALMIKVLPEEYVAGTVARVILDMSGSVKGFVLDIPAGSYGIAVPTDCNTQTVTSMSLDQNTLVSEGTSLSCTSFKLPVMVLSTFLNDPAHIIATGTIQSFVGTGTIVRASGFFHTRIFKTLTGEERRELIFLATGVSVERAPITTGTSTTPSFSTTTAIVSSDTAGTL